MKVKVRSVAAAVAALRRRRDVRLVAAIAAVGGPSVATVVGGAVRDALLGRRGGDLDLVSPSGTAGPLSEAIAASAGSRVLSLGTPPRRVFRIVCAGQEIDVWEVEGTPEDDLLRRDFTINAFQVRLPSYRFEALPGGLEDLVAGRLRPPRPGVFLEDPVRVLRAARFEAELDGFRLARSAREELGQAALLLPAAPAERVLVELDRILSVPPGRAAAALQRLDRCGGLAPLMPSATAAERSRGLRRLSRLDRSDPGVARAVLLSPLDAGRAAAILESWKVPRRELRLHRTLRSLPAPLPGTAGRRDGALFLRESAPFSREALSWIGAVGGRPFASLLTVASWMARSESALRPILSPRRPADTAEISEWLGGASGSRLGAALGALDLALASGEIRGREAARRLLQRRAGPRDGGARSG
jgi:hypothetical protein